MKTNKITVSLVLLTVLFALSSFAPDDIKGWFLAGSAPSKYEIGVEYSADRKSKVGYLKSVKPKIGDGFGTIMQSFIPKTYLGKKVKLTAYIKSKDVTRWAGMWMRVDGEENKGSLAFDNMNDRPIEGTTAWKKYEIVLSVPKESTNISYGVLVSGTGEVWMDQFKFAILGDAEPLKPKRKKITQPTNTSFDNQ